MRNHLATRRGRHALASLLVGTGLVAGVACGQGMKLPPPPTAGLSITPNPGEFGSLAVGSESDPITFTVENESENTADAVGVTVEGTNADNFVVQVEQDNCSDLPLDAGATCTVDVTFKPLAPAPETKQAELFAVSGSQDVATGTALLTGDATET
jgi:hypothetical protein